MLSFLPSVRFSLHHRVQSGAIFRYCAKMLGYCSGQTRLCAGQAILTKSASEHGSVAVFFAPRSLTHVGIIRVLCIVNR